MIESLIAQFSRIDAVEAIALGGSRAGDEYDSRSDYDIYIYCTAPIPENTRRNILQQHCAVMEIGNTFWEYEDNCTLNNGVDMDIIYRSLDSFISDIARVVEQYEARNGYTTCMWHNLLHCKILFDREGRLESAKKRFAVPYPQQLQENIVFRNYKLLQASMPAYRVQISKALERGDVVSVNHRVSAFMESYFDLLFALNGQTHPGEKRLIPLCRQLCPMLPEQFEENLQALFQHLYTAPQLVSGDIASIIGRLQKIL